MSIRVLAWGLVCGAGLWGQHRFSWQEACFKNPAAPYCQGHEYFGKHPAPSKKDPAPRDVGTAPLRSTPEEPTPSVIVAGGIDWRFADPLADALAGFNFSGLGDSPTARTLIAQLGANDNVFKSLCGVDQVALSVRNNSVLAMVTDGAEGSTLPALEAGWKAVPVSHGAMLIGQADAVDQAVQRIAMKVPPGELARWAQEVQGKSEFWAVGRPAFAGPQAVSAGVKRFALAFSMRNRFTGDLTFEYSEVPGMDALPTWSAWGETTLERNMVHVRMSGAGFAEIAASPLGQRLTALVHAARYLPVRDTSVSNQSKPVIYGLDDGPRVLKGNW